MEHPFSVLDVELTRRHDLIPNLVATVKGYAAHEHDLLDKLARAREQATAHQSEGPTRREGYEEALGSAVHEVLARVETFPSNLVAAMLGFEKRAFFELTDPASLRPTEVDL